MDDYGKKYFRYHLEEADMIITGNRSGVWKAFVVGDTTFSESGQTEEEAIGKLVKSIQAKIESAA